MATDQRPAQRFIPNRHLATDINDGVYPHAPDAGLSHQTTGPSVNQNGRPHSTDLVAPGRGHKARVRRLDYER